MSIQPRPLTDEEIKKLVERALQSPTESNYILTLDIFRSEYHPGLYYKTYELLAGEVREIKLSSKEVALVPLTIPIVILYKESTPGYYKKTIYVFTADGWKRVDAMIY